MSAEAPKSHRWSDKPRAEVKQLNVSAETRSLHPRVCVGVWPRAQIPLIGITAAGAGWRDQFRCLTCQFGCSEAPNLTVTSAWGWLSGDHTGKQIFTASILVGFAKLKMNVSSLNGISTLLWSGRVRVLEHRSLIIYGFNNRELETASYLNIRFSVWPLKIWNKKNFLKDSVFLMNNSKPAVRGSL